MKQVVCLILAAAVLFGCGRGAGNPNAPDALDDACAILDQRRNFLPAFKSAQDEYGVPIAVLMAMMWQESKFKATAPRR